MSPLVLLLLASPVVDSVSADPLVPAEIAEAPEAPAPPARASLFFSPLATVGMLASTQIAPGGLYVPIGGVLSLGPHWGITAELSGAISFMTQGSMVTPGWEFSAAVGPTYFLRDQGCDGFFVTTKFSFRTSQALGQRLRPVDDGAGSPFPTDPTNSYTFLIGADVGYQFHLRRLSIAFVLGASLGYGYNNSNPLLPPFDVEHPFAPNQGLAYAINVDLLRIGYAF